MSSNVRQALAQGKYLTFTPRALKQFKKLQENRGREYESLVYALACNLGDEPFRAHLGDRGLPKDFSGYGIGHFYKTIFRLGNRFSINVIHHDFPRRNPDTLFKVYFRTSLLSGQWVDTITRITRTKIKTKQ
ncbi:MAG: hypothetical protein GPJ52_00380 [Candidatus Heimdallarchaeota archaeon]|nr:hypothetical protein [Candidatus Heimdallarchaeota archaeon]MCG3254064.1 hypothetical protein [Candidatus Heimdallarchaeota archaeon]MCK4291193.1 hypothetical protein [Candidatus Heimdallarchaeota archaeon]